MAREEWIREMDPLDDLAPWVPADEPFDARVPISRAKAVGILTAFMDRQPAIKQWHAALKAEQAAPARDRRICVHPDAIRQANDDLGCVFTVEYANGDHQTFRVSRPKPKGDTPAAFRNRPLFGSVLTGSAVDSPFSYTYVGIVTADLHVRLTAGSKGAVVNATWPLLDDALGAIRDGVRGEGISSIENSGHCSRCGRLLTNPESLAMGVGPECREKE